MFRYVILFSLLCATVLGADDATVQSAVASVPSAKVTQRKARSIWPFTSSNSDADSGISGEHALLLEQAGLSKSFNLSSHPLWKIHKYHGIDLKPVQIQTEIIKPKVESTFAGENLPTTVGIDAQSTVDETGATSELPDLSFLDNLGGLAYFLPDPDEEEATELIANAIEKEESSHPGFFKKLWWKIWGKPENTSDTSILATKEKTALSALEYLSSFFGFGQSHGDEKDEKEEEDDSLTIYLPETQGSYMAVVLPSDKNKKSQPLQQAHLQPPQAAPSLFREAVTSVAQPQPPLPYNHANQYRGETTVSAATAGIEHVNFPLTKPVAQYPVPGSASQAWIQSWTPHAAYTVHVQGPSRQQQQEEQQQQTPVQTIYGVPYLSEASQAETPKEIESRVQVEQSNSVPSNLEPPAPVDTNYKSPELSDSWPAPLAQDVSPALEASEDSRNERADQQASRKSSQDSTEKEDSQKKNEDTSSLTARSKGTAEKDIDMKNILSHFGIPERLMNKVQVSQKDVDSMLNDKEIATRAAARLRSLQKEFEIRKEQLNYAYAMRVKKQL